LTKQFGLGRHQKLKSRKAIDAIFREGRRFNIQPYRVFYLPGEIDAHAQEPLQFGVSAGSRQFKKAVDRNRIKRLSREAWRLQKQSLELTLKDNRKKLSVFLVFIDPVIPAFETVMEKVRRIIDDLEKKVREGII
jgi:ribonuclease P protein component